MRFSPATTNSGIPRIRITKVSPTDPIKRRLSCVVCALVCHLFFRLGLLRFFADVVIALECKQCIDRIDLFCLAVVYRMIFFTFVNEPNGWRWKINVCRMNTPVYTDFIRHQRAPFLLLIQIPSSESR